MIKNLKTTLTPDDINNAVTGIFPVPKIVLPAPAAGKVNNILGVTTDNGAGGAVDYITGAELQFKTANSVKIFLIGSAFMDKAPNELLSDKQLDTQSVFSTTNDFLVTSILQSANGDFPIDIVVCYEERDLIVAS